MRLSLSRRRALLGALTALIMTAVLGAALLPLRSHLDAATTALVLVIPVVGGVSTGGFGAGVAAAALCFLAYDFFFLPPYYTFDVARGPDWVALGVYAVVAVIVARVVAAANSARSESQRRASEVRRLFDVSELLVRDLPGPVLLETIVKSVRSEFGLEGVSLLLPVDGRLQLVASAGEPLAAEEVDHLAAGGVPPVSLGPPRPKRPGLPKAPHPGYQVVALAATGRAVGLLAVRGARAGREDQELLRAFANHLALALERATLREEALRARLLGEADRVRRSLVGAVSHDLRTPLATIKLSASTLLENGSSLGPGEVKELAELVDTQADRLDRLVCNLLDTTRIQSGTLQLRPQPCAVLDLVEEALAVLGRSSESREVSWQVPAELPLVDVDPLLVRQALANLLDNAFRYSPPGQPVKVEARSRPGHKVELSVTDQGPGVPEEERTHIFEMFERGEAGGRGGLGLAIAQAFLEAHGERIWLGQAEGGGAQFVLTLPCVPGS